MIDSELLDIIVCPSCHHALEVLEGDRELGCTSCELVYPITDGIPVLLIDEARRRS
ncbi:MAG: Trm112 family protein [Nocardioides sp.]